jgi:hypothetical protein
MLYRGICILLLWLASGLPARGQDAVNTDRRDLTFRKDSVLLFAGTFGTGNMSQSAIPFAHRDDSYIVGGAYGRDLWVSPWNFVFTTEIGVAGRFDGGASAEIWGAGGFRQRVSIGVARLSLGLFVGLSAISDPTDIERAREIRKDGDATLLFYFTPELALQLAYWPQLELVYRLHHRSGLFQTLGNLREGANAHVLGLRWYY